MSYGVIKRGDYYFIKDDLGYLLSINNIPMNRKSWRYSGPAGEYRHAHYEDQFGCSSARSFYDPSTALQWAEEKNETERKQPPQKITFSVKEMGIIAVSAILIAFLFSAFFITH